MMLTESVLTCPKCAHQSVERMPTDACQFFYECRGCGVLLRPKPGDCCVFCSYGSVPCPPIQESQRRESQSPDGQPQDSHCDCKSPEARAD
jgi:hypothetical protein